eukprot:2295945-Pyramimonas_sp.AAC.1
MIPPQQARRRQVFRIFDAEKPWQKVCGTTGAMLLSLRSLGWRSTSAFVFITKRGERLDLRVDAPLTVRDLARAAGVRKMWTMWAARPNPAYEGMNPKEPLGYLLEPVIGLLRGHLFDP